MSKANIAGQMMVTSYDELLKAVPQDKGDDNPIKEIRITDLVPFKNHPFRVVDDDKMQELVASIQQEGVLNPILVRGSQEGKYEIISGHRRKRACEIAGVKTISAIVKELNDAEAINVMVDSNIQRENILPSEKAYAYKLKYEAEKQQGKRTDLTSGHDVQKLGGKNERIDEDEISGRQIRRYIRLTYLNKELLDMVDAGRIPIVAATELSYVGKEQQNWIYRALGNGKKSITPKKATRLKKVCKEGKLTEIETCSIILGKRMENTGRVCFSFSEVEEFFPGISDSRELKKKILDVLQEQKRHSRGV